MLFELTVALRYLVPRKRSLSTALIALMSVAVISLVVWLVLVFLSVTAGIEKNWLHKLTSLYAPVRISPTDLYYRSYYYQVDSLTAASGYSFKTLGEKADAKLTDPYSASVDAELSGSWPQPERKADGSLRDIVKDALAVLKHLQKQEKTLTFQDYEIGGALLRFHPSRAPAPGATLSQMSYVISLLEQNPHFSSLLLPPSSDDLNTLLKNTTDLTALIEHAHISELSITRWPGQSLPENKKFKAFSHPQENGVLLPLELTTVAPPGWEEGELIHKGSLVQYISPSSKTWIEPLIRFDRPIRLAAPITVTDDSRLAIQVIAQGVPLHGQLDAAAISIQSASPLVDFERAPDRLPPWAISIAGQCHLPSLSSASPVLLPKSYRDSGAAIGDRGTLSFAAAGATSLQEQRMPIRVAGFYDPGLFSLGGRCLIVPHSLTRAIHAASQTFSPDGTPTNGIFVWNGPWDRAEEVKQSIEQSLGEAGLAPYWNVSTYKDYEFSKELFQQFQSDRTLFVLIGALILLVACCNIISLLVLLVSDKKREIAVLQAMGAPLTSVAAIFGFCGLIIGIVSSLIGTLAAYFTLQHIDAVAHLLSALQGHAAFQPAFFGKSLPNQMSSGALLFILIATPLLSFAAALIPAWKASRIDPAAALRQE